jgi:hypothetical protein
MSSAGERQVRKWSTIESCKEADKAVPLYATAVGTEREANPPKPHTQGASLIVRLQSLVHSPAVLLPGSAVYSGR